MYKKNWFANKTYSEINLDSCLHFSLTRAVGRSENPGVPVLFGGNNVPPLAEIGLTGLSKSGGAMAPPGTPRDDRLAYLLLLFCSFYFDCKRLFFNWKRKGWRVLTYSFILLLWYVEQAEQWLNNTFCVSRVKPHQYEPAMFTFWHGKELNIANA